MKTLTSVSETLTRAFIRRPRALRFCLCGALLLVLTASAVAARAQNKTDDATPKKAEGGASAKPRQPTAEAPRNKDEGRGGLAAEVEKKRNDLSESEKLLLSPAPEDQEAFADFLKQPRTGLVRLLPREIFQDKLALRGGGAYYSFARLTHEYGYGSDIELQRDHFSTGFAGADFGFLVDLGDVPLEGVTRDTFGVREMNEYKPPAAEPKAREEYRRFGQGFQAEGFTYKSRLPVRVDNTYALRSINYNDSDVLVAFRVVRKDSDGSVVLLWRLLKKYSKPTLERAARGP